MAILHTYLQFTKLCAGLNSRPSIGSGLSVFSPARTIHSSVCSHSNTFHCWDAHMSSAKSAVDTKSRTISGFQPMTGWHTLFLCIRSIDVVLGCQLLVSGSSLTTETLGVSTTLAPCPCVCFPCAHMPHARPSTLQPHELWVSTIRSKLRPKSTALRSGSVLRPEAAMHLETYSQVKLCSDVTHQLFLIRLSGLKPQRWYFKI